jgi:hypothetical protein
MQRFTFRAEGISIGWSHLEQGDPPMGVAFGVFHPLPGYAPPHTDIVVHAPGGERIAASGVGIADPGEGLHSAGAEVEVLGIPWADYARLFPAHVAAYDASIPEDFDGST